MQMNSVHREFLSILDVVEFGISRALSTVIDTHTQDMLPHWGLCNATLLLFSCTVININNDNDLFVQMIQILNVVSRTFVLNYLVYFMTDVLKDSI